MTLDGILTNARGNAHDPFQNGEPEKVNIGKSGANTAALNAYNEETGSEVERRQNKYLNNMVEQDHRGVKRITNPMMGFKSFELAQHTLVGIEMIRMIKKGQMVSGGASPQHSRSTP